ncbi:hypothetical protein JL720_14064 [Aureococcus anophagefferens]|nr:hypothetical protein JL720_14064 [Aureococcus anophagefferens]
MLEEQKASDLQSERAACAADLESPYAALEAALDDRVVSEARAHAAQLEPLATTHAPGDPSRSPSPNLEPRTVAAAAAPPPLPVEATLASPAVATLVDRYGSSKKKAVPSPTRPLRRLSATVWKEDSEEEEHAPPARAAAATRVPGARGRRVGAARRGPGFGVSRSASPPTRRGRCSTSRARRPPAPTRAARDALNRDFVAERRGHEATVAAAEARLVAPVSSRARRDAVAVVATGAATALLPPLLRRAARLAAFLASRRGPRLSSPPAPAPGRGAAVEVRRRRGHRRGAPGAASPAARVVPAARVTRRHGPRRPGDPGGAALPPLTPNLSRAATGLFMHAPLAFLNSLFAGGKDELRPGGEEKRRPGVARASRASPSQRPLSRPGRRHVEATD